MVRNEFTFPSADKKAAIHAVEWLPEGQPTAVLQISHGVAEYCLRYEPFAEFLTGHGFAVVSHDHLGHGTSAAAGAPRLYFGPSGSWNYVVDDLYTRRCLAGKRFPKLPYFLLGHSMGSFLARTYLIRYPGTVDGAILMGTGQMSPAVLSAGKVIAAREARRVGEAHSSPVIMQMAFDAYNKCFAPNRTAFDWISASIENVDAYVADPLCGENPSIGLFREMLSGLSFNEKSTNLKKMNTAMPVLFISGALDPVGDRGKGVEKAAESFRKAGMRKVSVKLYPGLRHEILNEDCRMQVYQDLLCWLNAQMGREA